MARFQEAGGRAAPPPLRDTTRNLVEAIWADEWPRNGAIVDFGLRTQAHYESLYYGVREGQITPGQLDDALGRGEALTALTRAARSNPHRDIRFRTDWDDLPPEQESDADGRPGGGEPLPSPDDVARGPAGAGPAGQDPDRGDGRGRKG